MENTFLRCLEEKFKKTVLNFSKYLKIKIFNIDFFQKIFFDYFIKMIELKRSDKYVL